MAKILFVEDQMELRAIHTAFLQSHGYDVITAATGEDGLELARTTHPDVVVLDHVLPNRTGVEIASIMHDDPALTNIPVILMTAVPYGAIGRRATAAGCKAFLAKPCTPRRLLEEVRRVS